MPSPSRDFRDTFDDDERDIHMSDEELEALLAGHGPVASSAAPEIGELEPGTRVRGVVIDVRGGEVLVELDSKTHGVIAEGEFDDELPAVGGAIQATFERHDAARDLAILGVREARRQVMWDELRPGMVLEGTAIEVNRGGLVLDIKGVRAFLPLSQIDVARVEEPAHYVGQRLVCEVTSVDRADENLVVSRRVLLEREAETQRGLALSRLSEGEVLKGTVTRVSEHGAFVDLGGIEGLIHASKLQHQRRELGEELRPGSQLEVVVTRIDRQRGRVSLDSRRVAGDTENRNLEGYETGDEATGWVTRISADGAHVSIEEGVVALMPRSFLLDLRDPPTRGSVVRVAITRIDRDKRLLEVKPVGDGERG